MPRQADALMHKLHSCRLIVENGWSARLSEDLAIVVHDRVKDAAGRHEAHVYHEVPCRLI
jgi:hypothetical protein